jgi:hypothetical protein
VVPAAREEIRIEYTKRKARTSFFCAASLVLVFYSYILQLKAIMAETHITPKSATRFTGFLLLVFIALSILHFSLIETRLVGKTGVEIFDFVLREEQLFRWGIVIDLILFIVEIMLATSLYRLVQQTGQFLARVSWILFIVQAMVAVVIELSSLIALYVVESDSVGRNSQTFLLYELLIKVRTSGYGLTLLFFGLSLAGFFYSIARERLLPVYIGITGTVIHLLLFAAATLQILMADPASDGVVKIVASLAMLVHLVSGCVFLLQKQPRHLANALTEK